MTPKQELALVMALQTFRRYHNGFDFQLDFCEEIAALSEALNEQSMKEIKMDFTIEQAMEKFPQIAYWYSEFLEHNSVQGQSPMDAAQEPAAYQNRALHHDLISAKDWDNVDPQWHWMYRKLYTTPPVQEHEPENEPRVSLAHVSLASVQKPTDDSVRFEYLEWLASIQPRHGVGGNEAWNAGVAWAKSQQSQEIPEGVLAAIRYAGLTLLKTQFGYQLKSLGSIEAQTAPATGVSCIDKSNAKFQLGDNVRKIKGSSWRGKVVGTYSTSLTPQGYAVESNTEYGSVQIYPASALELIVDEKIEGTVENWESGRLGESLEHTRVCDAETTAAINVSLGMPRPGDEEIIEKAVRDAINKFGSKRFARALLERY